MKLYILALSFIMAAATSEASVDLMIERTIVCTAIRPLFEGELTIQINNIKNKGADVEVAQYKQNIGRARASFQMRPANLRYDLFNGSIGKDSEGNSVYDGVFMDLDSSNFSVSLALNGVGQANRKYVVVRPFSKLKLNNPAWGEFEITECRQ